VLRSEVVNLRIDLRDTLLYAFLDREIELSSSISMMQEITNVAKEKGLSKILVDGKVLTGDLSDLERINLAVKTADHLKDIGTSPVIAVVGNPPTFNGLAVLAAQSVGADVQLFREIKEGIDWLSRSPVDLWR
jgi:hypothetical protein